MMQELFFELLRVGIGTQSALSRCLTADEWQGVFEMARKQSVVGVAYAGVCRLPETMRPEENLMMMWTGLVVKIQQRNMTVNRQCEFVQGKMAEAGFRTYIMKGQGNAALYPDASLRQSGDIDIFLEGGLKRVMGYVNSMAPTREVNELEVHFPAFSDTDVEIHYRPMIMRNVWKNRRLQGFFERHAEECFANRVVLGKTLTGEAVAAVPTRVFNLIHQMVHIHLHLFTEGIGMRQLMDYFFVLKVGGPEVPNEVWTMVERLGLRNFAAALMWVLGEVFGLEREFMLCEPNEKDGRFLLSEVMRAGNFGRFDEDQRRRKGRWYARPWLMVVRNLRLWRFDRWDWLCGPAWRLYYNVWRRLRR